MIPKIIHYCWFGGNSKSELIMNCIESWKKFEPDYEIIEWNESNWNINYNQYTKEAYHEKKWAFVSDVARLDIIYNYGGIYLDTDVELKRPIDELLNYSAFFASDDYRVIIATGLGFGAEARNKIVKSILDDYKDIAFIKENGSLDETNCTERNTNSFLKLVPDFKIKQYQQVVNNMLFISYMDYSKYVTHYCDGSWRKKLTLEEQEGMELICKRNKKKWLLKLKDRVRSPQIYQFLENNNYKSILKIYLFFTHDFLDYGTVYFIKKYLLK